jgi:hypothetical protein
MPCTLSPMPGCTVSISPVYAMAVPGIYNIPNIWIRNAITDANGIYSIIFDAQPNLIVDVTAAKAGVGAATPVEVSLVKQSVTVDLVLQDVAVTPPPTHWDGDLARNGVCYLVPSGNNPAHGNALLEEFRAAMHGCRGSDGRSDALSGPAAISAPHDRDRRQRTLFP